MLTYTDAAIRASFFDFAAVAHDPESILAQARYLDDGVLTLREGRVVDLRPWQESTDSLNAGGMIDLRGKLIIPGFVDCHIHYPQTEMIGAFGEQLLEWLNQYTFPVEAQYHCPDYAAQMSAFFLQQLLANGTTSALIFGTVHPQSVDALFSAAEALNMRIIAGKVMMDRNAPDYLTETPEESYAQTEALIARWHERGRLNYALTPRFAPTSSPALLEKVQALRQRHPDVWVHTHLSENPHEVAWVKQLFPDHNGYLDVYHQYQLTGRRSVFAHCLHLETQEWQCLHDTNSAIAFCPTSNLFLGSGLFNIQRSWQQGVNVGIGTDVGAGTTFNMLQTLGEAYKVGQLQQYKLSAAEAFYHATLGGAHALDLDKHIGNFAPGKEADFVVLDPAVSALQRLRMANSKDIWEKLFVLMTLGDDRNIVQTWVNGRPVWQSAAKENAA
ncbi:guanine deaminase [Pantoea stewartii]|uniref:Guanine deaminase n=1 Tax=Pantoea stewartii subsp. stewartii DC283 TaxID=660596 RepID=H3RCY0_PANSE|nr:guanine deaminase [Pantoea stewartii]ARF50339.1 guanine deaminase [Pantoea stewartii subsp. stewartii DC283]EHU00656.1 guanine deaminase [Pantoea stewartii subsp. stewartii DC283]KAB0558848.1 guanine deaminase [Pantoea stewartii subsp. stewartii]